MQFALGEREKCVCDAGQERPATSAVSGETINRYRETSFLEMFRSDVDTREVSANSLICYINMYTQDKHLNTHVLH